MVGNMDALNIMLCKNVLFSSLITGCPTIDICKYFDIGWMAELITDICCALVL